jgi:hypothetical protein
VKTHMGVRPSHWEFGCRCLPDWSAEILFRKRRDFGGMETD